jgi:hypothetical protein
MYRRHFAPLFDSMLYSMGQVVNSSLLAENPGRTFSHSVIGN